MLSKDFALFLEDIISLMKRIFTLLMGLAAFGYINAQNANEPLEFKQTEYDFGKIPQNKPVYVYFEAVNKGDKALKIENVTAACGCTTPEWSKEEIAAGGITKIKVGFNAASDGYFEKPITITYNGNVQKHIKIKGTVWKAPAGSAPSNASVQFLKQQIL